MSLSKRALSRVGQAAIAARMSDPEVERDPAKAMMIAMDAMRATLGSPQKVAAMRKPELPKRLVVPMPEGGDGREYLIYSHKWRAWHRRSENGGANGYTDDIAHAGVFDRAKARSYHDETVIKCRERTNTAHHVRDYVAVAEHRLADALDGALAASRAAHVMATAARGGDA